MVGLMRWAETSHHTATLWLCYDHCFIVNFPACSSAEMIRTEQTSRQIWVKMDWADRGQHIRLHSPYVLFLQQCDVVRVLLHPLEARTVNTTLRG